MQLGTVVILSGRRRKNSQGHPLLLGVSGQWIGSFAPKIGPAPKAFEKSIYATKRSLGSTKTPSLTHHITAEEQTVTFYCK